MTDALLWILLGAVGAVLAFLVLQATRKGGDAPSGAGREVRDELRAGREEDREAARALREEISSGMQSANELLVRQMKEASEANRAALDRIRSTFDDRVRDLQTTFDARVKALQEGNEKKLDEMRRTVDEKLQTTLERRLGDSFKLVSERLEAVHQGLGEMQSLAAGVGDLKRALTNVKVRGTWAEVQLGAILEDILAPSQWMKNVQIHASSLERVEYAIRLPGPRDGTQDQVWLPIDSKFPQEDYLRLQEAAALGDAQAVQSASQALLRSIRTSAKTIRDKYVSPPLTTDFAILFLATEGLHAEALRTPGFVQELYQEHRVVVAGPTTLAAILSSLRMGFQTLAIGERAAEVWRVLGAVKMEFGKFGEVLDKVKRQLNNATKTIEQTGVRTRAMERRLRDVESLPEADASALLGLVGDVGDSDDEVEAIDIDPAEDADDSAMDAADDDDLEREEGRRSGPDLFGMA